MNDYLDLCFIWYRDVLLYKAAGSEEQLIFREQALEIRRQAEKSTYHGLQQILEAIETADRRIRANVNFDLTMEMLAMTIKENIG